MSTLILGGLFEKTAPKIFNNQIGLFFDKNHFILVISTLIFMYVLALRATKDFIDLEYLKSTLEQKVIARTAQLHQEKEAKTQFFISLAHETKTPLTLINNYLEKYQQSRNQMDLQIVSQNIKKLSRMMVNFLDINKLERGQLVYDHNQILDLSLCVQEKIAFFTATAHQKQIRIKKQISANLYLKADPYAIDRILNNLLDNAFKFTPYNGLIEVCLRSKNKRILLSVQDSGPGIREEQQNLIFIPFSQTSKSTQQGIGMGLSLVKRIIEQLNGDIIVKNPGQRGAFFLVDLPFYVIKPDETVQKLAALPRPVHSIPISQIQKSPIKSGRSNLLVVEDNVDLLCSLQSELEKEYNFYPAQNGHQALQILQKMRPHLILSDIMMDNIDGLEFIKNLPPDYRDIPFIFITAKTTLQDKLAGLDLGAVDYLCKPFDMVELTVKIKSLLKQNEARQNWLGKRLVDFLASDQSLAGMPPGPTRAEQLTLAATQYHLTNREKQVLSLLLDYEEPDAISEKLFISRHTVVSHIKNIYKKLNLHNKYELLQLFDPNSKNLP